MFVFPFLVLILSIFFTIDPTNLKKNLTFKFLKNMIKPPSIWSIYLTLLANFQIMLRLMKWNGFVPLLNILHKSF